MLVHLATGTKKRFAIICLLDYSTRSLSKVMPNLDFLLHMWNLAVIGGGRLS